jgi:hypothetical protein
MKGLIACYCPVVGKLHSTELTLPISFGHGAEDIAAIFETPKQALQSVEGIENA